METVETSVEASYHQWTSGSGMSSGEPAAARLRNRVQADRAQVSPGRRLGLRGRRTARRRRIAGALLHRTEDFVVTMTTRNGAQIGSV